MSRTRPGRGSAGLFMSSRYDERDVPSGAIVMRQQKSTLRPVARARCLVDFSRAFLPIWKAQEESDLSEDKWLFRTNPNVNRDTSVAIVKLAKAGSFFISGEN